MPLSISLGLPFLGGGNATAVASEPAPPPGDLLFEATFTGTGSYTLNGAPCTVDDLLIHNAGWGAWNPATMITSSGLVFQGGVWPTFASVIFDQANGDGLTLVGSISIGASTVSGFLAEMNDDPTYTAEDAITISNDAVTVSDYDGSDTAPGVAEGTTTFAMNISNGRMAVSVNGGTVLGRDVAAATMTLLGMGSAGTEVANLLTLNGRALVAEADLPTLSA